MDWFFWVRSVGAESVFGVCYLLSCLVLQRFDFDVAKPDRLAFGLEGDVAVAE